MGTRSRVSQFLVRLVLIAVPASLALEVTIESAAETAATPVPTAATPDVIEVYMYRASSPVKWYALENVDTADLYGVLKYIHTEVIAEHTQSRPERHLRKYDIGVITQWKVWVRNPTSIVNVQGSPYHVDFGQYMTYDYGQATNFNTRELLGVYGDFVGVQSQQGEKRYASDIPYYWYSLPGFCPNLPYVCTNGWGGEGMQEDRDRCLHTPPVYTAICSPDKPCPSKGSRDRPRDTGDEATSCEKSKSGEHIMGGLCDNNGTHPPNIRNPSGDPGCVYSYDYPNRVEVKLDELTGITQEECYSGKCTDWTEFRLNCKNDEYKKVFKLTRDDAGKIVSYQIELVAFCVEYDINPFCEEDCNAPECVSLPENEKEIGLPFWKGRCDPLANARRAETLAHVFGIKDAQTKHLIVNPASEDRFEKNKCDRTAEASIYTCNPNPTFGGPYCSRHWSRTCTPCQIPGTKSDFPDQSMAYCPLDVVKQTEYLRVGCYRGSCCASRDPLKLCCLYYDSCVIQLADVGPKLDTLPLDEGSLKLVEATRDSAIMLRFVKRLVMEWGDIVTPTRMMEKEETLKDVAYWQWGHSPSKSNSQLHDLKAKLELVFPETLTGVPTPQPTTRSPTPAPTTQVPTQTIVSPAPTPLRKSGSGNGGSSPVLIVLIILLLGVAVGGGSWYYKHQAARRFVPMDGGNGTRGNTAARGQQEMAAFR